MQNLNLVPMLMSNEEYGIKLDFLEKRDPLNPFIDKLRKGNSAINAMYLMQEINDLPNVVAKPIKKEEVNSKNKAAVSMEIQLRHLRQSRNQLSNDFHLCATDSQRAAISERINELTKDIVALNDRLDNFVKTQQVPETPKSDKYPIPTDGIALFRLQGALRNRMNRAAKRISQLFEMNPDDKRIKPLEQKFRELKIYRSYVDAEIRKHESIQS